MKVGGEKFAGSPIDLPYTHFGLGYLHNCTEIFEVITPRRESAENEREEQTQNHGSKPK